ncbi:MAG TPA: LPS assembly protein LptD [Acidobacteriota bacterium]
MFSPLYSQNAPRATAEIPRPDGVILLEADRIERLGKDQWSATGNVRITHKDMVLTSERVEYNSETDDAVAPGRLRLSQGIHWIEGSRAELNLKNQTGRLYDAEGFTDREFYIKGDVIIKTGPETYKVEGGFVTSCNEALPKWSFNPGRASIRVNSSVHAYNAIFRVKSLPVFYTPFVRIPLQRKRRASGFLLPASGTSNNKGRRFSEEFYLTLGESADVTILGEYFTQRGPGYGATFRARPNKATDILLNVYSVNDRLRQGGTIFLANAHTQFANGFRGVAMLNLTTNLVFRQVFSDTFRAATTPNEISTAFLTNNFGSLSFNISFNREETFFPVRNILVRSSPSIQLRSAGAPLGRNFRLEFESTLEGLNRSDALLQTPDIVQRFDFFPRIYYSGLKTSFLSIFPKFGARETFYSNSRDTATGRLSNKRLNREYLEAVVDVLGPVIERRFELWGGFRHTIEPEVRYRWIQGINEFPRIIRFDEVDAVADTNEVEYGITQRFFRRRNVYGDGDTNIETMSFQVAQKYFFDPTFGGALDPGSVNQFYPLNTLTGFLYATEKRRFSPVTAVFRFNPSYRYSADLRADYDTQRSSFRNTSVTGSFSKGLWYAATTYFLTRKLDPSSFTSNQIQTSAFFGNRARGFSAGTTLNYDIQRSALVYNSTRLNYFWDCCGVSLQFFQFDVAVRRESQFRFSFFLKGIGTFGTIPQPESLF